MIEVSRYYDLGNKALNGNPFISAIPKLSRDILLKIAARVPKIFDSDRELPDGDRIAKLSALDDFFFPLTHHIDFLQDLWNVVLNGYRSRNPLKPDATTEFNAFMESISENSLEVGSDAPGVPQNASTLIGTPGTGKTRLLRNFLANFPDQVMHHWKHGEVFQLLYIFVEAPDSLSFKELVFSIYTKLYDEAAKCGYMGKKCTSLNQAWVAELEIQVLVRKLSLGFLVVDEVQSLAMGDKRDFAGMKFFTNMINRIGVPVILIGSWPALALFGNEMRLMRRTVNTASTYFRKMKNDEEWISFLNALFCYQYTRSIVSVSTEISDTMYELTQGIADLAVKLFALAQTEAIRSGREELCVDLLTETSKLNLANIEIALRKMRGDTSSKTPFLDLEPIDVPGYMAAVTSGHSPIISRRPSRSRPSYQAQDTTSLFTNQSYDASTTPANAAKMPAIGGGLPKPPRLTGRKSSKREKEIDAFVRSLDPDDFRAIVHFAKKANIDPQKALADKGHVISYRDEVLF